MEEQSCKSGKKHWIVVPLDVVTFADFAMFRKWISVKASFLVSKAYDRVDIRVLHSAIVVTCDLQFLTVAGQGTGSFASPV